MYDHFVTVKDDQSKIMLGMTFKIINVKVNKISRCTLYSIF